MSRWSSLAGAAILAAFLAVPITGCKPWQDSGQDWSEEELRLIRSLSLDSLLSLPPDPSNRVADHPAAAALGRKLFFDTRLSGNGKVACASCHLPDRQFQDDRALGKGTGTTNRRTMPIAGTAYSPWQFWDGRKDSQWSQALGPLESPVEHGTDRTRVVHLVAAHYRVSYEAVFGPLPDLAGLPPHAAPAGTPEAVAAWESLGGAEREAVNRAFANVGKVIAAYERTLLPAPTRFDAYAEAAASGEPSAAESLMSAQELQGLRLFIGKAACINCHNGPLLTDSHFHNTGVPGVPGLPEDTGRAAGASAVRADPFNCLGPFSDAAPEDCAELRFMTAEGHELVRAFKTPSLRDVAERPPYMHAGQIATLGDVLRHYDRAPASPAGHTELTPLSMSNDELAALQAFLGTLNQEPAPKVAEAFSR